MVLLLLTFLFIVTPIVGVCNCSMFCCTLLYVHSSFAIILMGKRDLVVLLSLSSWCLLVVVWLFLAVSWVCLRFVIVLFPDQTHLLFLLKIINRDVKNQDKEITFKIRTCSYQLGPVARKPVFGVSNKLRFKPVSSATETS